MLQRYEGKRIRLTDEYGEVFTGVAEAYPSGFGLHEFDRAEESIRLGDTFFFLSQIRTIEELSTTDKAGEDPRRYDVLMGKLLEGPYRIVDILPGQAPAEGKHGGQYFAVERYFLQAERLRALRRRYAELLLRINCYYRMDVSFDSCGTWETNPDPGRFADRLETLSGKEYLRAVFPERNAMADLEPGGTHMTVYDPSSALLDLLKRLAEAEGFFVWSPPQTTEA